MARTTKTLRPRDMADMNRIADELDVQRSTVRQWKGRHADFPKPVRKLSIGLIWDIRDVKAWARIPRPPHRPTS